MCSRAAEHPTPKAVALFTKGRHTIFVEVEWDGCSHGVVEALFDYPVLVLLAPILVEAGVSGRAINIMRHAAFFLAFMEHAAWKNESNFLHDH